MNYSEALREARTHSMIIGECVAVVFYPMSGNFSVAIESERSSMERTKYPSVAMAEADGSIEERQIDTDMLIEGRVA